MGVSFLFRSSAGIGRVVEKVLIPLFEEVELLEPCIDYAREVGACVCV